MDLKQSQSKITKRVREASDIPRRNLSPTTNSFSATGKMKAVYCAIGPMLKAAPIATGLANMRSPKRAPMVRTSHTALTGVLVRGLTFLSQREQGSAPSLEYA